MAQSYFWSCLTLSDECPFFSSVDPNLFYYGIGLLSFYAAFILVNFADLNFNWSLDGFQSKIDYYINVVRKKVRRVQMDQRRLMSAQARTEKQRKRSDQCKRVVNALRFGLTGDDQQLSILNDISENPDFGSTARRATWSECHSIAD